MCWLGREIALTLFWKKDCKTVLQVQDNQRSLMNEESLKQLQTWRLLWTLGLVSVEWWADLDPAEAIVSLLVKRHPQVGHGGFLIGSCTPITFFFS